MNKPRTIYGFFSATQARLTGTKRYRTVDGRTVELTLVSETEDHGCMWDDVIFVGEVAEDGFVEQASKGEFPELDNLPFDEFVEKWKEIYDREKRKQTISRDPKKWN